MDSSSSDSVEPLPSRDLSRSKQKVVVYKTSERVNEITTVRDYLSLLLVVSVNLPIMVLRVNTTNKNGNGSYYFPYIIVTFVIALPVLYMEMFLGQYTRRVSLAAWRMSPISYGVFVYLHIIAFLETGMIGMMGSKVAWYIYSGLADYDRGFPWSKCDPDVKTTTCYNISIHKLSTDCVAHGFDMVCADGNNYQFAETQYFYKSFFADTNLYAIRWTETACLSVYWLVIWIFLLKRSFSPKLALVTVIIVFSVLVVILLHVLLEFDGARNEMGRFLHIKDARMFNVETWYMAFIYAHQALAVSSPATFAFSSRVCFKSMPEVHALIIAVTFIALQLLVLITSYSILGVLVTEMNVDVDTLRLPWVGILFSTYLHFLNKLGLGQMWTFVFLSAAMLSIVVNQVVVISGLVYSFTTSLNLQRYRVLVAGAYCALSFLVTSPISTEFGQLLIPAMVELVLHRGIVIGFAVETTVVFWSYGIARLADDVCFMCGAKPNTYWMTTWSFIPTIALGGVVYSIALHDTKTTAKMKPAYVLAINIMLAGLVSVVLLCAGKKVVMHAKEHELSALFEPTFDWGPPNKELRKARKRFFPDKYIPSQHLSTYHTSSTSWALVKEEMRASHLSYAVDRGTEKSEEKRVKQGREALFF